ncbi:MAG: dinitrogenase iron-molybdenum cofactor biosynthesis protein [Clostridiales Family XIII bacterium]|jgi:predicted Fe-Mo cluster-binding NifX family protein|nr:dinitrogenase iron-molybdenum cofactor biosynthesis protein [Clostridiales Family XIII bacterium]
MGMKIAVTTTDRLTLHRHFGQAESFHILEFSEDGSEWEFTDLREARKACGGGGHDTAAFDGIIALLSDCDAVVAGKIGPGAYEYLASRGLRAFEATGALEKVIPAVYKSLCGNKLYI